MAVTETRIQIRISNLNSRDLFACKWLRAPATNEYEVARALSEPEQSGLSAGFVREQE